MVLLNGLRLADLTELVILGSNTKRHLSMKPLKNTAIHKMKNIKARQIDELQFPNYN